PFSGQSKGWLAGGGGMQGLAHCKVGRPRSRSRDSSLGFQDAPPDLVLLDGLEQRLEVAFTEALVPLALDDLEEDRANERRRENLQKHLVFGGDPGQEVVVLAQPLRVLAMSGKAGVE